LPYKLHPYPSVLAGYGTNKEQKVKDMNNYKGMMECKEQHCRSRRELVGS